MPVNRPPIWGVNSAAGEAQIGELVHDGGGSGRRRPAVGSTEPLSEGGFMRTIRPRRAAALLAVLALLLVALPAAAAPERTAANEPGVGVPLLHSLAAWLTALWPGSGQAPELESAWEALGAGLDPGGAPQPSSGLLTVAPQLGSDADLDD